MGKKLLLMLLAGVVIGGALGYYLGRYQAVHSAPGAAGAAGPTMAMREATTGQPEMPPGMPGQNQMKEQMNPADEKMHQEIAQLKETLKQNPGDVKTLVALGNHYYDMKDFKQAIGFYDQAFAKDKTDLSIQVDLATSYWYAGDTDRAVAGLQAVLQKNPNHPQALNNMGIIMLHGKNDLAGAREYWSRLVNTGTTEVDLQGVRTRLQVIDKMLKEQQAAPKNKG